MQKQQLRNLASRIRKKLSHPGSVPGDPFQAHIQECVDNYVTKAKTIRPVCEYEIRNSADYDKVKNDVIWLVDESLNDIVKFGVNSYTYPGYCDICQREVEFRLDSQWVAHTEGLCCKECGTNSRLRNLFRYFIKFYKKGMRVYINEESTNFYQRVKKYVPDIIGSEYAQDRGYRFEDTNNLSFEDKSIDIYLSNDVFEHVFDYERGFCEAARVLKNNGIFLFHVPFSFNFKTIVRATLQPDGSVRHLETPIYHGNPINPEDGSLWVNDFGFDMFETVKKCGFSDAYAILSRDVHRGILNRSALVFIARV